MTDYPLYACRLTRALLSSSQANLKAEIEERLHEIYSSSMQNPDKTHGRRVTCKNGMEIDLIIERDGDKATCKTEIDQAGAYKINATYALLRKVPDSIAVATIAGKMTISQLIGRGLIENVGIDQIIRHGIVFKDGEQVDDLTNIQSNPPWDQDASLTVTFAVQDEGFEPVSLADVSSPMQARAMS